MHYVYFENQLQDAGKEHISYLEESIEILSEFDTVRARQTSDVYRVLLFQMKQKSMLESVVQQLQHIRQINHL